MIDGMESTHGAFLARHSKDKRSDEITQFAKKVRGEHERLGAVGYCYGAWAAFRMGDRDNPLVDCISVAHPSFLDHFEIDKVAVPVQIIAPEHDPVFTEELKAYCHRNIPSRKIAYDYQFFPGVTYGFANKGDQSKKDEMKAMERAKEAMVTWSQYWLHSVEDK